MSSRKFFSGIPKSIAAESAVFQNALTISFSVTSSSLLTSFFARSILDDIVFEKSFIESNPIIPTSYPLITVDITFVIGKELIAVFTSISVAVSSSSSNRLIDPRMKAIPKTEPI